MTGELFLMKTRIISAAVAIVIAVIVLLLHKTVVLEIAVALLIAGMLYELFNATGCLKFKPTAAVCIAYGLVTPFSFLFEKWFPIVTLVFVFAAFTTNLALYKDLKIDKLAIMVGLTILVSYSMNCLLSMHSSSEKHGLFLVVLTLCGAWLADSGAYFAGTFFGKHKLCPNISPKKTVEGFIGGTVTNGVIFILVGLLYSKCISTGTELNYILLFVLGMACSVIGLLGDLSASLIKRQYNIKDYGNIMPGHGGVMDRFDSVLFVAPFMATMLTYFSVFG